MTAPILKPPSQLTDDDLRELLEFPSEAIAADPSLDVQLMQAIAEIEATPMQLVVSGDAPDGHVRALLDHLSAATRRQLVTWYALRTLLELRQQRAYHQAINGVVAEALGKDLDELMARSWGPRESTPAAAEPETRPRILDGTGQPAELGLDQNEVLSQPGGG